MNKQIRIGLMVVDYGLKTKFSAVACLEQYKFLDEEDEKKFLFPENIKIPKKNAIIFSTTLTPTFHWNIPIPSLIRNIS